jgi:hypothetical protein
MINDYNDNNSVGVLQAWRERNKNKNRDFKVCIDCGTTSQTGFPSKCHPAVENKR